MNSALALEIVVVGGGTAGWMAAAALRALSRQPGYRSRWSSPTRSAPSASAKRRSRRSTFSIVARDRRGRVPRATTAPSSSASRSTAGASDGQRYIHASAVGRALGLSRSAIMAARPRARDCRRPRRLQLQYRGSAARHACRNRRGQARIPDLAYAYHFDASLFAQFLRRLRRRARRRAHEGKIVDVERDGENGDVAAVAAATAPARRRRPVHRLLRLPRPADRARARRRLSNDWTHGCRATAPSRCRASAATRSCPTRRRSRARPDGSGASRSSTASATATSIAVTLHERR